MARKTDISEELVEAMAEVLAFAQGKKAGVRVTEFESPAIEVKRIREKMRFTQDQFATVLGVSASGLRKWEQKQRHPRGAALTLLRIMDHEPVAVARALAAPTATSGTRRRASAKRRSAGV